MPHFISPHLFLLLEKDGVLVWDYKNHNQYLLEKPYFSVLENIARGLPVSDEFLSIIQELEEAQLICKEPPEEETWGWDILSKIFHLGTQNVYSPVEALDERTLAQRYLEECKLVVEQAQPVFVEKPGQLIDLPSPNLELLSQVSLLDSLKRRKTCRHFFSQKINLESLSTLLFASFGLVHGDIWQENLGSKLKIMGLRTAAPASGGLHTEEVYLSVYRVEGLAAGVYHYRRHDHKLTLLELGDFEEEVVAINYQQFYSRGLACGFYVTSRLDKMWWKYKHSKAFKTVLLDLGHVSQNFLLVATALNFQTWMTAAFEEKKLAKLLKLANLHESPFLFLGVGYGSGQAIPDEMYLANG